MARLPSLSALPLVETVGVPMSLVKQELDMLDDERMPSDIRRLVWQSFGKVNPTPYMQVVLTKRGVPASDKVRFLELPEKWDSGDKYDEGAFSNVVECILAEAVVTRPLPWPKPGEAHAPVVIHLTNENGVWNIFDFEYDLVSMDPDADDAQVDVEEFASALWDMDTDALGPLGSRWAPMDTSPRSFHYIAIVLMIVADEY